MLQSDEISLAELLRANWQKITFAKTGGRLTGKFNTETVVRANEPESLPGGYVVIQCNSGAIHFDDIELTGRVSPEWVDKALAEAEERLKLEFAEQLGIQPGDD